MHSNRSQFVTSLIVAAAGLWPFDCGAAEAKAGQPTSLWDLAQKQAAVHRFATLFTAHDMRQHLATEEGIQKAIAWCKQTGVTHAFLETFRDGYRADRAVMEQAKARFRAEGFVVSGCVTTTQVGKPSTRSKGTISCYTDQPTQAKLQAIFEFTASLFDEIMIDDFWFTDCTCTQCEAARQAKTVTVGGRQYSVRGNTWEDYRDELMVRVSRERILRPAKRVNPRVKVIIKYPQWYDNFHARGYQVLRETADFDRIWVGTETRDYNDQRWGGTVQYEAYFIMRWLGGIGGKKCGGGWYDWLGTTERTYVEQARQTVLGGARESLLFCYGGLQRGAGPKNVEALQANLPELLAVAQEIRRRQMVGIAAYKPANSHPESEPCVFDFVGMLGLPLTPCHEFPTRAPAALFSLHALKDPRLVPRLKAFCAAGKPVLITDGLAAKLDGQVDLRPPNVHVLPVKGNPKSLLAMPAEALDSLRRPLLAPWHSSFRAPNQVALYLGKDGSWVIENFNDAEAKVQFNGKDLSVPARGWIYQWK